MTAPRRPALTPKQWAKLSYGYIGNGRPGIIEETGGDGFSVAGREIGIEGVSRHALAALALHGQEFGFTRADVEACRNIAGGNARALAEDIEWERDGVLIDDGPEYGKPLWLGEAARQTWRTQAEFWDSLAERIEALLPPPAQEGPAQE